MNMLATPTGLQNLEGVGSCESCGEPCAGQWLDTGNGSGEHFGTPYNDVQWCWVSECCECTILDEGGNEVEPPEDEQRY